MANNFEMGFKASAITYSAGEAHYDELPTNGRGVAAFNADTDQSIIITGHIPVGFTGSGTLKLDLYAAANTTTAADDARIDVATEVRTPDAGTPESINADNFDGTPDSGTFTFSTTAYSGHKITIILTPAVTPVAGDLFRIKITRDANHATLDSLASDLFIPEVVFYEAA